jgi:hypothetical protein
VLVLYVKKKQAAGVATKLSGIVRTQERKGKERKEEKEFVFGRALAIGHDKREERRFV